MTERALLLIENLPSLGRVYKAVLTGAGYSVVSARTAQDALAKCAALRPAAALLDLRQSGMTGLDLMRMCLAEAPQTRFILVAANGSVGRVVEAMRAGAYDYIVTPIDEKQLLSAIANAMIAEIAVSRTATRPAPVASESQPSFLGASNAMRSVHNRMAAAARSAAPVLVHGEVGTGKTLAGQVIHARSARRGGPFDMLDCRDLAADALERAYSADQAAANGTLCLDEFGHLDARAQARLVQLMRRRDQSPRLVVTTTEDPETLLTAGRLQPDLYFRLKVLDLPMPPLRRRDGDIRLLAEHFLARFASTAGTGLRHVSDDAAYWLERQTWPGNVRQLANALHEASILNVGPVLEADMLERGQPLASVPPASARYAAPPSTAGLVPDALLGKPLSEVERMIIETTIARVGGSVPKAAQILGLSPSTIYRKREGWDDP